MITHEISCNSGKTVYRNATKEEISMVESVSRKGQEQEVVLAAKEAVKKEVLNSLASSHPEVHKALVQLGLVQSDTE